jgi:hypothetical protein
MTPAHLWIAHFPAALLAALLALGITASGTGISHAS